MSDQWISPLEVLGDALGQDTRDLREREEAELEAAEREDLEKAREAVEWV